MPEYLSPGVYIEEVNSGPRPIEGVGTAMAAFVGFAPTGPVNQPTLVTNWSQYLETFGALEEGGRRDPHLKGAYLSHAVFGYFQNGGGRAYITRIGNGAGKNAKVTESLQLPSKSSKAIPSIAVQRKPDVAGDIEVEVAPPTGDEPADSTFTLKVRLGSKEEVYENVSLSRAKGTKNAVETVNQLSQLIVAVDAQSAGTLAERAPEIGTYLLKTSETALLPQINPANFTGDVSERSGIEGLALPSHS